MDTQKVKAGAVISAALEIYGSQVWVLIPAAVVVFAIVAVASLVFSGGAAALVSLFAIVLTTFYQGMVVELVADVQDGRRDSSVGQLFRGVAPIVLPLIGLSLVVGIGILVGLVLLIVPGLILWTMWAVAAPSLVIERKGALAAMRRSRELVRGHGWQVFGVILVVLALALIAGILVAALASGLGNGGVAVVQWAANVIFAPFTALVIAVLYFTLRRLHGEGEPAAPAATQPPASPPPSMDIGL
ncbi:MAG TPA: hypothetical protein VFW38_05170 [Solirubrobacteraceae bacterium]|nr:hypothetical protein [Solirubrobacteraceae bacterium]